jgi:hypothetical protein
MNGGEKVLVGGSPDFGPNQGRPEPALAVRTVAGAACFDERRSPGFDRLLRSRHGFAGRAARLG